MQVIDRAGTFRGFIVEHGVSETPKGYPQFVGVLKATEFYDETGELTGNGEPGYIDWAPYDQSITSYLVLYTKGADGQWAELRNAEQIKKALGWDGLTFESLAAGKYDEKTILFRVEEHEYNGKTSLKVNWIDAADANPTKTLAKYDAGKLAGLTAKMGSVLVAKATAPTPARAPVPASAKPAGAPVAPPRGKPGPKPKGSKPALPSSPDGQPAAPSTAAPAPAPAAPATAAPSTPPPVSTTPPPAPAATPVTKESAWAKVNSLSKVDEAKLAEIWLEEGAKIGKAEDKFSSDDWHTVQEAVLARVSAV
jgi:hypothetical protein